MNKKPAKNASLDFGDYNVSPKRTVTGPVKRPRSSDWNYGGQKWKLSRSKIDLYVECPRCFYLDNKLGYARPKFPAFLLNSAVDILLKKEFDLFRHDKSTHPLMKQYGIDAIPFTHPDLEKWRENFVGIQYSHAETGFIISGAVDDLWVNARGEIYVVDYKSTSKEEEITMDGQWKEGYKRQMEVYQWLLRKKGFEVAEKGYFVYANGDTGAKKFDGKLEFEVTILDYVGDTTWIEDTLFKIKEALDSDEIPASSPNCEHCQYHNARNTVETD